MLILPIVSRTLTPGPFGRLDVLTTLASALTSVLMLGLDVASTRMFADLDEFGRRRLFGTWLAIGLVLTAPLGLALAMSGNQVSLLLFDSSRLAVGVGLVGAFIVAATLQLIALTVLRNTARPLAFAVVSGGSLALNAFLVVLFLHWNPTVQSVLLANVISQAAGAALGLVLTRTHLRGRPNRAIGVRLARLGLPLVPSVAAFWLGELIHRIILLDAAGDAEVGLFGVAVRFASVTIMVVLGFQTAWQPRAFDMIHREGGLAAIAVDGARILAIVALSGAAIAAIAPEAVVWVSGEEFQSAVPAVGWMLSFAVGFGVYQIVTMPSAIDERLGDIGLSSAIGIAAAISMNLMVAGRFGAAGTAGAMAFGQWVAVGYAVVMARSRTRVPFDVLRTAIMTCTAIGVILVLASHEPSVVFRIVLLASLALVVRWHWPASQRSS